MNGFFEVLPIFIIFPVIYLIVKASLDYCTRKQLIEKGLVNEDIKHLFYGNNVERYLPSSLKWGLVLVFVGITMVVLKLLPYYIEGEVIFGVALVAAGAGLLVYYGIASKKAKEAKKEDSRQ